MLAQMDHYTGATVTMGFLVATEDNLPFVNYVTGGVTSSDCYIDY